MIRLAVSRSTLRVTIDEITESQSNEVLRSDRDEPRIVLPGEEQNLGYAVGIEFLRVDPGLLHLLTGVPVVVGPTGDIVGFDLTTRLPVKSFALEVWTRLSGPACVDGQRWGYTLLPWLAGGYVTGFEFAANSTVTFNLVGARTQRGVQWGLGPYPGVISESVSGNVSWHQTITPLEPPEQTDGWITSTPDVVDNGTPSNPHPLDSGTIEGGSASGLGPDILEGGTP